MKKELNPDKPCSTREHIDSIDKPGFCVWCDAPLKCKVCGVSKGHASDCVMCGTARSRIAARDAEQLAAQLRAQTHDPDGKVKACSECGNLLPLHTTGCPRAPGRAQSVTILDPLRAAMLDIAIAIEDGGTLILTGPNSVVSPNDRQYGATLEDAGGELSANAYGLELSDVLVKLVSDWKRQQHLEQHQAEHDRALS